MSLLPEGQENNVEVTWADQQKINQFLTLIQKKDALEADLKKVEQENEYLTDVIQDLELLELEDESEDAQVQYKIGDAFVFMGFSEATERATLEKEQYEEQMEKIQLELSELESTMALLKSDLYSKFGDNINLERD